MMLFCSPAHLLLAPGQPRENKFDSLDDVRLTNTVIGSDVAGRSLVSGFALAGVTFLLTLLF